MKIEIFEEATKALMECIEQVRDEIENSEAEEISLKGVMDMNQRIIESKDYSNEVRYFLYGALHFIGKDLFDTDIVTYKLEDTQVTLSEFEVILLANKLPRGQMSVQDILSELETIEESEDEIEKWGYIGAAFGFIVTN